MELHDSKSIQVSARKLKSSLLHEIHATGNPNLKLPPNTTHTTPPLSPCNVKALAAHMQVAIISLECRDDTRAAHTSATSIRDLHGDAPLHSTMASWRAITALVTHTAVDIPQR